MMSARKKAPANTNLTAFKANRIIYLGDAQKVTQWDELSPTQLKLAMYSAAQVRPDDTQQTRYTLTFKQFADLTGMDEDSAGGADYKRIFTEAKRLAQRGVDFIDANGDLVHFNWLFGVRVSPKSGTIAYSIEDNLLPFYKTRSGAFAVISLLDYMPLRGKYSLLLYEFLAKWRTAGQVYQTIPQLREQLQVPPNLYPRTVNFLQRVLKGAVDEINEKSTVSFRVRTVEKRGPRDRLEGIMFILQSLTTAETEREELLVLLTTRQIDKPAAHAIINARSRRRIMDNIAAADRYIKKQKELGLPYNMAAITCTAIANDWAGADLGQPLFDVTEAAPIAPPEPCKICAGKGIITGPDDSYTHCKCVALPPAPVEDEDRQPITGPIADAFKEVFAEIGNGPAAAAAQPTPAPVEPEMDPETAARHELALLFTAEARRRMREREARDAAAKAAKKTAPNGAAESN